MRVCVNKAKSREGSFKEEMLLDVVVFVYLGPVLG